MLPLRSRLIHVRWSGEGCWVPLGDLHLDIPPENATSHPAPGQLIVYPGGLSECEILLAYGSVDFSSKVGQLAGNHFARSRPASTSCASWVADASGRRPAPSSSRRSPSDG